MTPDEVAERILDTLQKQKFFNWYNHDAFAEWISRVENAPTKEKILADIKDLFNL